MRDLTKLVKDLAKIKAQAEFAGDQSGAAIVGLCDIIAELAARIASLEQEQKSG
jgi:hypothetical protein